MTDADRNNLRVPLWDVVIVGYHQECDPVIFYAPDAGEAAWRAVEHKEQKSVEYHVAGGREEATVLVRPAAGDGEPEPWRRFVVRGEAVPQYYAKEV